MSYAVQSMLNREMLNAVAVFLFPTGMSHQIPYRSFHRCKGKAYSLVPIRFHELFQRIDGNRIDVVYAGQVHDDFFYLGPSSQIFCDSVFQKFHVGEIKGGIHSQYQDFRIYLNLWISLDISENPFIFQIAQFCSMRIGAFPDEQDQ